MFDGQTDNPITITEELELDLTDTACIEGPEFEF